MAHLCAGLSTSAFVARGLWSAALSAPFRGRGSRLERRVKNSPARKGGHQSDLRSRSNLVVEGCLHAVYQDREHQGARRAEGIDHVAHTRSLANGYLASVPGRARRKVLAHGPKTDDGHGHGTRSVVGAAIRILETAAAVSSRARSSILVVTSVER